MLALNAEVALDEADFVDPTVAFRDEGGWVWVLGGGRVGALGWGVWGGVCGVGWGGGGGGQCWDSIKQLARRISLSPL